MALGNRLITKTGRLIDADSTTHHKYVECFLHTSLKRFINTGGIRVKLYGELMAVEAGRTLTDKQVSIINKLLKQNEVYQLIMCIKHRCNERNEFRRIQRL